jgi:Resolvase, N terminal domain
MKPAVAYIRVSTRKQSLGLEAQQAALARFAEAEGYRLIETFQDMETGTLGRRGICVLCGTMKSGSIVQCQECGFMPTSDAQLVMALMLNEAQMGNFEQFVNAIKSGARPEFSEQDIQKVAETLPELRRMIGLQSPQDYTRELTERFLTDAVGMATHGLADTITHGVPGELSELSKERMLVVLGCIIKDQLLRRAPVGERNFIERVFGKRLALMSKHSGLPALAGVLQVEFAMRVEQAAAEFDAGAFEFSTDWQTLENTIISFVLPKMDAVREYMRNSERDPYAGRNLVRIAHLHAKAMAKNSEKWS